jgi:Domain of unknown function (DUF4336)
MPLMPFAPSLWTAATPIRFAGTWFPHVMTAVRLDAGGVLLHSPCFPSPGLFAEVAQIGDVSDVVAPNWFHDLYLQEYRRRYPRATFWAPEFLRKQKPGLIDRVLDGSTVTPWFAEMPHITLSGLLTFGESPFFHRVTRTLIVADFLMNPVAGRDTPLTTRIGYRLFGLDGRLRRCRAADPGGLRVAAGLRKSPGDKIRRFFSILRYDYRGCAQRSFKKMIC